jgi:hypothetical protein
MSACHVVVFAAKTIQGKASQAKPRQDETTHTTREEGRKKKKKFKNCSGKYFSAGAANPV